MTSNTAQFNIGDHVERVRDLDGSTLNVPVGTRFIVTHTTPQYAAGKGARLGVYNYDLELVNERDRLVEAADKAYARYEKRTARMTAARKIAFDTRQALQVYDEAHRKPTFSERVAKLGLGAVVRGHTTTYIKVTPNGWVSDKAAQTRLWPDSDFRTESQWTILSEGVTE